MMDDATLETLYKANINTSHFAGLRGVWDDGFAAGANFSAQQAQSADPSATVAPATVVADTPTTVTTV